MRIYGFMWGVFASVVTVSVAAYDVMTGGLPRMLALGLLMAVFAGMLVFVLCEERSDRWRWTMRSVVWTGIAAPAFDAYVTTWGSAGLLVGIGFVASSPVVVHLTRGAFVSWSSRRTGGVPESLGRRDLLRRWESTTAEVVRPSTPMARRLALVEERSRVLDELERRDPSGFGAWTLTAVPQRSHDRRRRTGR